MIRARAGLGSTLCCSLGRLAQRQQQQPFAAGVVRLPPSLLSPALRRRLVVLASLRAAANPRPSVAAMSTSAGGGGGAPSTAEQQQQDPRPGAQGGPVAVREAVVLSEQEEALFATLLAAARAAGQGTVLRAAGGWVRDKLLGRASVDIDIALDNMYGKDFAEKVNEYLTSQGIATHSTAVIQSNPDQSKHLETARIKVPVLPSAAARAGGGGNGSAPPSAAPALWIDLVNLRSETYAEGSRIPTMEFGTPQQDAERRDFTINALFYNLNESRVEDLTGKGLQDLRAGLMRTPLPARTTFSDDPLRALRAVRFGTRLGFALDSDIVDAAASDEIRAALSSKVSRERIGTELDGMLCGPAPSEAVATLARLRLFPAVFAAPDDVAARLPEAEYARAAARCCAAAEALERADAAARLQQQGATTIDGDGEGGPAVHDAPPGSGTLNKEERRLLLLAALLLPLRGAVTTTAPGGAGGKGGNKPQPAASAVVRNALKWRAKDAEGVALLHEAAPELAAIHARLVRGGGGGNAGPLGTAGATTDADDDGAATTTTIRVKDAGSPEEEEPVRVALGRVMRRLKESWRLAALLVPLLPLPEARPLAVEGGAGGGSQASDAALPTPLPPSASSPGAAEAAAEQAAARLAVARDLEAAAEAWSLSGCWAWKPLLDGKAAMAAVGMARTGPALGKLMGAAADWQLAHPRGTAEECAAWLSGAYDAEGNAKEAAA